MFVPGKVWICSTVMQMMFYSFIKTFPYFFKVKITEQQYGYMLRTEDFYLFIFNWWEPSSACEIPRMLHDKSFWQHCCTLLQSWKTSALHMSQNRFNFKISSFCLNVMLALSVNFCQLWWANSWCCTMEVLCISLTV